MYAITGITGQVGSVVARALLAAGKEVRAVVRDAGRGEAWTGQGCEVAVADMNDTAALTTAFTDVEAVFVLLPPNFDPSEGFPETRAIVASLRAALIAAGPARVVCLSTIGAQASQVNLLSQLGYMEQELGSLPMPITFLRAAWFIENFAWDVESARAGAIGSFLQPLDKAVPMVATADVGWLAAELLQEDGRGKRVVELEGPTRLAPLDIAAAFSRILGRPVRADIVARDTWTALFTSQGMNNPLPRIQMLDGFNQGWIAFEASTRKGMVAVDTALQALVEPSH